MFSEPFLGHFCSFLGDFWVILGSLWGHFWPLLGHFKPFWPFLVFPALFLHFFVDFITFFSSFYSSSDCKNWLKRRRRRKWQVFKKCFVVIIGASILMNEILCAGKIPTWGWFGKVFPLSVVFPLLKVWCHWPPSKIQSNYNRTEFSNQF